MAWHLTAEEFVKQTKLVRQNGPDCPENFLSMQQKRNESFPHTVYVVFLHILQVSLVVSKQALPESLTPASKEPCDASASPVGSRFEQTTLEQADTTQGEGAESEVTMDTVETNISAVHGVLDAVVIEQEKDQVEEEVEEEDRDSDVQETDEG